MLNVRDLAKYLRVSRITVYRYIQGGLPFYKIGSRYFFRKEEIDAWLCQYKRKTFYVENIFRHALTNLSPVVIDNAEGGQGAMANAKTMRLTFVFNGEVIPGTIYQRETKKGKRWCINFQTQNKKRVRKVARLAQTLEEAAIVLQEEIQKAFDYEYSTTRRKEKIIFRDFCEKYLELYAQTNKTSWKTDRSCLKNMNHYFGNIYPSELTSEDIEKFKKDKLSKGLQKSTVNRYLAILRKMLNLAKDWGHLSEDKEIRIRLFPERDNLKERILSEDEEKRLLQTSSELVKSVIIVALNTGMRLREILNLKWNQINFNARIIKVDNAKNGRIRFVDINTPLLRELQMLRSRDGQSPCVFSNPETGKPYLDVKKGFKAACRRAEISGLRFHDLRHTFASRLVEKGVHLITVKDLLGHSTVKMTERYAHSSRQSKRNAVELLAKRKS